MIFFYRYVIRPLLSLLLRPILFLADSVMAAFIYGFGILGFGTPGLLSVIRLLSVIAAAFFLSIFTNNWLTRDWSEVERLSVPAMISSGSVRLDSYRVNYGFQVKTAGNIGSYFRVSDSNETLFELIVEGVRRNIEANGILDPERCFSLSMPLPSKIRLRDLIEDATARAEFSVNQQIYEICRYGWPFPTVVEPKVSLDRLSLLELLRQEFESAVEASGEEDEADDGGDSSGGASGEAEEPAAGLSGLSETRKLEITEVYLPRFLAAPGILRNSPTDLASTGEGVLKCAEEDTIMASVCREIWRAWSVVAGAPTNRSNLDDTRCGMEESILDRICDVQSAMFTNGRIQFVSLVVFYFGILQLLLIFTLGVLTPYWIRLTKSVAKLWSGNNPTVVTQIISTQRFTKLYPDLTAPVIASIDILPMIGFFGTIVGISGAMTQVAGVKSSDKVVELLSLGSMTTNIGVAFETTKFALILSAALLFLKLLTDRIQALSSDPTNDGVR